MADDLQEVKPLREVPRVPVCCEKNMRRMQHPSSSGGMLTVYVCDSCGKQTRA